MKTDKEFLKEIVEESNELGNKIVLLEGLLDKPKGVSQYHVNLLRQQLKHMNKYHEVLIERMADLC